MEKVSTWLVAGEIQLEIEQPEEEELTPDGGRFESFEDR